MFGYFNILPGRLCSFSDHDQLRHGWSNIRGTRCKIRCTPKEVAIGRSNFLGTRCKIRGNPDKKRVFKTKLKAYEQYWRMKNEGIWKMKVYEK